MVYMGMGHNIDMFKPVPDKGYAVMEKLMRASLLRATKRIPAPGNAVLVPLRRSKPSAHPEIRAAGVPYRFPFSPEPF